MDITRRRELASRLLDGYVHGPAAATEATSRALAKVAAAEAVEWLLGCGKPEPGKPAPATTAESTGQYPRLTTTAAKTNRCR